MYISGQSVCEPQQLPRPQAGLSHVLWNLGSKLCLKMEACISQLGRSPCAHLVGAVGLPGILKQLEPGTWCVSGVIRRPVRLQVSTSEGTRSGLGVRRPGFSLWFCPD